VGEEVREIVSVGNGRFVHGIDRMRQLFPDGLIRAYRDCLPYGCPTHQEVPYAFKSYALKEAADAGATSLLWLDSIMIPGPRPLEDLWEKIERDGYYIGNNGFSNYEWTADSAYRDLGISREENREIKHVVGGVIGLDLTKDVGANILAEYFRLAKTKAFCGPWRNGSRTPDGKQWPCGPRDVRGHRHDQTALSVIAWRLGCALTDSPEWFAYDPGQTDQTCIVAKGIPG
jgi:hypothetical protein